MAGLGELALRSRWLRVKQAASKWRTVQGLMAMLGPQAAAMPRGTALLQAQLRLQAPAQAAGSQVLRGLGQRLQAGQSLSAGPVRPPVPARPGLPGVERQFQTLPWQPVGAPAPAPAAQLQQPPEVLYRGIRRPPGDERVGTYSPDWVHGTPSLPTAGTYGLPMGP